MAAEQATRTAKFDQRCQQLRCYAENQFYLLPELSLIAGAQYTHTSAQAEEICSLAGALIDQSKKKTMNAFRPKQD